MKAPLPATVLLALALVACGGDGEDGARPPPTRPAASPSPAATGFPPIEGTVPGEGFGGTDPVVIKSDPDPLLGPATLEDVRVGAHPEQGGWDRIVFEFRGARPSGEVRYVPDAAQCGSGMPVDPRGSETLMIAFRTAQAHDDAGQITIDAPIAGSLPTVAGPGNAIVEAKQVCDFEGVVQWAVGVDGRQRFNVRFLANPTRVIIDVKW